VSVGLLPCPVEPGSSWTRLKVARQVSKMSNDCRRREKTLESGSFDWVIRICLNSLCVIVDLNVDSSLGALLVD